MQMGISRRIFSLVKTIGRIIAQIPRIIRVLKIFEPVTLPIAISLLPLMADKVLTVSSGIDVPTAITVRPTINSGTRKRAAIPTQPLVRRLAP